MAPRKPSCENAPREKCHYYELATVTKQKAARNQLVAWITFFFSVIVFGLNDPTEGAWFGSFTVMMCSNLSATAVYPRTTSLEKWLYGIMNGGFGLLAAIGLFGMFDVLVVDGLGILCFADRGVFGGIKLFAANGLHYALWLLCVAEGVAWAVSGKYVQRKEKGSEQTAATSAA